MSDAAAPSQSLNGLIRQALALLNRDDLFGAEQLLQTVLQAEPGNADALQLLALVRRGQGQPTEAEALLRRSLAANPAQPHVHHNLGNLLASLGRNAEAVAAQREALKLKPDYMEAMLALGQAQQDSGDLAAAEKTFRAMLHVQPGLQVARQCLANVLSLAERPREAETVLRQALAQPQTNPRQTAALTHNLGLALKKQKRHAEALDCFDRAKAMVPDMPLVDYNRAATLQQLKRSEDAIAAYRAAIRRNPGDVLAHRELNQLFYRLDRGEEFLGSYDEAMRALPEFASLPLGKADLLHRAGRHAEALENFERAIRLAPASVSAHDGRGLALAALGRVDEAVREHEATLAMEPENVGSRVNALSALLRAGLADRALEVAEEGIRREPANQTMLAMWGLALRALDDPREAELNDYEKFVQVFELDPPKGFSDMESFNRELDACLDRLHTDKREYLDQTLRGGTQTLDNLFSGGHDPVNLLRAEIDKAVAAYIARMKADASHPLLKHKAGGFRYTDSWSSRLHDCGFHTNHVHPRGWISSAYYVAVPDAVADDGEKQGWIKFGEPHIEMGLADPIRRAVKPRPGTLVLFPSYTWHGTVPFRSTAARTTVAFDVVPK
ncbi:MAG TPA: tetratricopeptide repeat protein [Rhizomicrobium sp.]|nr:tetratricopeptide repeat protein [Rhizomicrobium sp.]